MEAFQEHIPEISENSNERTVESFIHMAIIAGIENTESNRKELSEIFTLGEDATSLFIFCAGHGIVDKHQIAGFAWLAKRNIDRLSDLNKSDFKNFLSNVADCASNSELQIKAEDLMTSAGGESWLLKDFKDEQIKRVFNDKNNEKLARALNLPRSAVVFIHRFDDLVQDPETRNKLEKLYDVFEYKKPLYDCEEEWFKETMRNEKVMSDLFSEKTIFAFHLLQKCGYRFSFENADKIISLANDETTVALLASEDTQNFIKTASSEFTIDAIQALARYDVSFRPAIARLAEDFDQKVSFEPHEYGKMVREAMDIAALRDEPEIFETALELKKRLLTLNPAYYFSEIKKVREKKSYSAYRRL